MIKLFPFQEEDVKKLSDQSCVLIANEMGTGKTYEAIARDLLIREKIGVKFRTLVVCPLSVVPVWSGHYEELTDLKVVTIDPKKRGSTWNEFKDTRADVLIVHWDCLRMFDELRSIQWGHIIADEVHRAKNRKAQQTRALKTLKSPNRTGLSGTPVINRPDELWSILNWLHPQRYTSYWKFFETYCTYEIQYPQGYRKVSGPKNVEQLQSNMGPWSVRRLKKDVLPDLPDKYYTKYYVELSPTQRKAYDAMKKDMIAWVGEHQNEPLVAPVVIAQLIRLQQFAAAHMDGDIGEGYRMSEPSSKIDTLMQILEDNPEVQVVVFSQFKQLIALVNARLADKDIAYRTLTGDVSQDDRSKAVEDFQEGRARVFTGTIAAGGVGITLTAASTIVFLDRSWSPALNQQAEDRLHRIGQKEAVQVIDIIAKNTVDLGRMQRLEEKWSWIKELLGDA